jgi:hypothetical protein
MEERLRARRAERRRVRRGTWWHAGWLWRSGCVRAGDVRGGSSAPARDRVVMGWLWRSGLGEGDAAAGPLSQSLEVGRRRSAAGEAVWFERQTKAAWRAEAKRREAAGGSQRAAAHGRWHS